MERRAVRRELAVRGARGESGSLDSRARAISSAGERFVHTEEVTGSIPVSPTSTNSLSDKDPQGREGTFREHLASLVGV